MHATGDFALGKQTNLWSAPFFLIQPFALFFEWAVREGLRSVDITSKDFPVLSSAIGYIWVLGWFAGTFPIFMRGLWDDAGLEFNRQVVLKVIDIYRTGFSAQWFSG